MRLQTFYLLNIQLPQESRFRSPEELIHFNWDDELEPKEELQLTEEDWIKLDKIYSPKWQSN